MMNILWLSDPKLHQFMDSMEEFLRSRTKEAYDAILLTGYVCARNRYVELVNNLSTLCDGRVYAVPSMDCYSPGKDIRSFSGDLKPWSWDLRENGPVFIKPGVNQCAIYGRSGVGDGAHGSLDLDKVPPWFMMTDFTRPSLEERFNVLGTRSRNEARKTNALAMKAERDRSVGRGIVLLGVAPFPSVFTREPQRQKDMPLYVSKGMGEMVEYRSKLPKSPPTHYLCSGGEEYVELKVNRNTVHQGGGFSRPGGNAYLISVGDDSFVVNQVT